MNPAICITLFRRPEYTKRVLDALLECEGIDGIPVYLSQDWAFEHNDACEAVRLVAKSFQSRHRGPSRYYVHSDKLGIDLNKLFVIPLAFEDGSDFVIFLEDDHVPSRDAVRWFIERGEEFKDDERIGFIGGYARQTREEFLASSPEQIVFAGIDDGLPGFNPNGWATWKDRWEYFLPNEGEDYKRICGSESLFDHFMHLRHGEKLPLHSNPETVGIDKPRWPGLVSPKIARIQLIGWENAVHTPSKEHFLKHEFNEYWMGNYGRDH